MNINRPLWLLTVSARVRTVGVHFVCLQHIVKLVTSLELVVFVLFSRYSLKPVLCSSSKPSLFVCGPHVARLVVGDV